VDDRFNDAAVGVIPGLDATITGMVADIIVYLIPLFILGGIAVLLGVLALLGRIQGGRFMRPIANFLLKLPWVGPKMKRASVSALERKNPELASAVRKLERMGANKDPVRAQKALSSLSAAERKAYMDMAGEQGVFEETAAVSNRAMRRQMARTRKTK
jgi:hypothetical protein